MTTDAEDIARSLSEPAAFAAIFDRHFDAVHAYFARRLGRDAADDLAAQVFHIAFEQRARFDPESQNARPWLYGIATNLVRRHHRSESRRLKAYARSATTKQSDDVFEGADTRIDAETLRPLLARALSVLRDDERDVLLLHTWEELSYADIATAPDLPIGTIRSRLSRCRVRLRELLSADGQSPVDIASAGSEEHG